MLTVFNLKKGWGVSIRRLVAITYIKMSFLLPSLCAYENDYDDIVNEVRKDLESMKRAEFICISLGKNCPSAELLNSLGIRHRSYPFDWNDTPFEALYSIIEDDFKDFINPKVLRINNHPEGIVTNTKYKCWFHHTFDPGKWIDSGQALSLRNPKDTRGPLEAFQRRIIRFREVLKLGVPIYFFRLDYVNPPEAVKLRDLLYRKFPDTKFTLVCLHEYENPRDWHGEFWSKGDWDNLENIVHLILYPSNSQPDDDRPFAHILHSIELLNTKQQNNLPAKNR